MTTIPQHLKPGAEMAVRTCMAVTPADRVVVVTDHVTQAIGEALAAVSRSQGAETLLLIIEEFAERPVKTIPAAMQAKIEALAPTVTFFAASAQPGELPFRTALTILGKKYNVRHAHMVGIDEVLMQQGMTADYQKISALTQHITAMLQKAKSIHVVNPQGTDLTATFDPKMKWQPCHGLYYYPGAWGNLPEGETFTCPAGVEGVVVANVLGDYFSEKYGLLPEPVVFTIAEGVVQSITSENEALAEEVSAYLDSAENGRRIGEFAIGTNIALKGPVGNLLQDEKLPGIHIAFGSPLTHLTGADWESSIHVDVIPLQCTIDVDGRRIMTDGVFAPELLKELAVA